MSYPLMYEVEQQLVSRPLRDIPSRLQAELARWPGWDTLKPGARIAITAGSRGIANIPIILRTLCADLTRRGFQPFIVPAMGSHGGATAEGQRTILNDLGIRQETVGAPILGSMEVDVVGHDKFGHPVLMDRLAFRADGLIVVNRVKKHTDFNGATESGLLKMTAIGLGKHNQASYIHSFGAEGLRTLVPEHASIALSNSPVLFGLAILEDGYDATSDIIMILPHRIAIEEPKLLHRAKRQMACLPVRVIDLLIVDRMGKEISGAGMDTNVIGRYRVYGVREPAFPKIRYLAVLDLTDASHGNAIGLGLADITTRRLVDKIDPAAFYLNSATAGALERGKIPLVCPTDRDAIDLALRLLAPVAPDEARVVRIRDTLHLTHFQVSKAIASELRGKATIVVSNEGSQLMFSAAGELIG